MGTLYASMRAHFSTPFYDHSRRVYDVEDGTHNLRNFFQRKIQIENWRIFWSKIFQKRDFYVNPRFRILQHIRDYSLL